MVRKNMLQVVLGKHANKNTMEILEKLKNIHGRSNIIILDTDIRRHTSTLKKLEKS